MSPDIGVFIWAVVATIVAYLEHTARVQQAKEFKSKITELKKVIKTTAKELDALGK